MNKEKEIISHSAMYTLSMYIRIVSRIIGGLVVAKILGPALYGLRNAFNLGLELQAYADLGTYHSTTLRAPYHRGAGNHEKADLILSSTFWLNACLALCICISLLIAAGYMASSGYEQKYIDFVFYLGLMVFTQKVRGFFEVRLQVEQNFALLSKVEALYGILSTVICIALAITMSFKGVLIGLLVTDLICIAYTLIKAKLIPRLQISFDTLIELMKIGLPMVAVLFLLHALVSGDRVVVIALLSEEDLGYYGVASIAAGLIGIIPRAISSVTKPKLNEKLGETQDIQRIYNFLSEPLVIIAYFLPFLLAGLYLAIHLPINYLLTEYKPSIDVTKIITLAMYFDALAIIPLHLCFSINKQRRVMLLAAPIVIFNFVLSYYFVTLGWGINGVAIATGVCFFLFSMAILTYALVHFHADAATIFKFFALSYLPFIYCLILLLGIDSLISIQGENFWQDLWDTCIQYLLFALGYSLIFIVIWKQSALVKLRSHIIPVIQQRFTRKLDRG